MASWDVIVVGIGGLGGVVAHDLAAAGCKTLGLDRFPPGHDRGSSHGDTRVIRQAYFEHPDYVPLLLESYSRWAELEAFADEWLFHRTGVLEVGPEDGIVVPGVLRAAAEHGLRVQALTGPEIESRFPGVRGVATDSVGVFEEDAGYLRVERCAELWAHWAVEAGAELRDGVAVQGWGKTPGGFVVATQDGDYHATRLVLCPGAWAKDLLPASLASALTVRRKVLLWYGAGEAYYEEAGFPCWLFERPEGIFYGFPAIGSAGLKVAEHSGGDEVADPLQVDRELHDFDRQAVEAHLSRFLPGVRSRDPARHAVCMYTLSPDDHFLVGPASQHSDLWIGAGLSGHGFKLVPALGRRIVDGLLGLDEPGLQLFEPRRVESPE